MNDYFIKPTKPTKDFCYKPTIITSRAVHRNEDLMNKALENLIKEHKSTVVITKSGNIILKTEEEIINYFLKRIKPNGNE